MDVIRDWRARRALLERMLRAWREDVVSVPLPTLDQARVDEVGRWLRAQSRSKAG